MKVIILFSFAFFSDLALASPFVCFTSPLKTESYSFYNNSDDLLLLAGWPACQTMDNTVVGLNAVSISMAAGGLYMACTGIGAPATVVVEGASIGIQVLSLIVGELPCDDSVEEKRIEAAAKKIVCEELRNRGIACAGNI